jgi:type IV pilus assembly protein PilQ
VPLLGDLPVLGYLFKTRARSTQKTELLVFITPKIVTDRLQNAARLIRRISNKSTRRRQT